MVVDTLEHIRTGLDIVLWLCPAVLGTYDPCKHGHGYPQNTQRGLCHDVVCPMVLGLYDLCKYGRGYRGARKGIVFLSRVVSNE